MCRSLWFAGLFALLVPVVGCGGSQNTLTTDDAKMTIDEYNALQAEEEAKISEAMSQTGKGK